MARVLVVDDSAPWRELLVETLDAEVVQADSGDEARAAGPVDLVVMDLHMPGGGPKLIRDMTALGARVLVVSGSSGQAERTAALKAGAIEVIEKTGSMEMLLGRIQAEL